MQTTNGHVNRSQHSITLPSDLVYLILTYRLTQDLATSPSQFLRTACSLSHSSKQLRALATRLTERLFQQAAEKARCALAEPPRCVICKADDQNDVRSGYMKRCLLCLAQKAQVSEELDVTERALDALTGGKGDDLTLREWAAELDNEPRLRRRMGGKRWFCFTDDGLTWM